MRTVINSLQPLPLSSPPLAAPIRLRLYLPHLRRKELLPPAQAHRVIAILLLPSSLFGPTFKLSFLFPPFAFSVKPSLPLLV